MDWLMDAAWWPSAKAWMMHNEKLSGWAQAVGALLAIGIAILVPALQRYSERRSAQIAEARRNLALVQGLFYLLRDVGIFLEGFKQRRKMPRKLLNDPVAVDDLLSRIAALESREDDPIKIAMLFRARGALNGARMVFVEDLEKLPLSEDELRLMEERIALVSEFSETVGAWLDEGMLQRELIRWPLGLGKIEPIMRRPVRACMRWTQRRRDAVNQ